jgi:hypothetical protein
MKNVSLETVHCCVEKSVGCIGGRIIEKRRRRKEEVESRKWDLERRKRKEEFSATIHPSYESHLVPMAYGIHRK